MLRKVLLLAIILVTLIFSGCASMKADPSTGAGFVPMQEMAQKGDLPFNKAWVKEGMAWKNYKTIYIKPVNTTYLMETDSWKQNFRQGHMKDDARELARYMEDRFRTAFTADPDNQFRAVGYPSHGKSARRRRRPLGQSSAAGMPGRRGPCRAASCVARRAAGA